MFGLGTGIGGPLIPMSEKEATPDHGGFSRLRYAEQIQLGFLGGQHSQDSNDIVAI